MCDLLRCYEEPDVKVLLGRVVGSACRHYSITIWDINPVLIPGFAHTFTVVPP